MGNTEVSTLITIDDHPLLRKGIADLIDMDDSLQLVGEAADGEKGIELAKELNPDLILLDINMKGLNGLETLKRLKQEEGIDSHVLMLTVSDNEDDVITALRLGADGYLLKDMEPEDILRFLGLAVDGMMVISERLTRLMAKALSEDAKPPAAIEGAGLTEREDQILKLIAHGLSNKHIARELDISLGTVKVHVKNLLKKLNLHSRVEAAVWALKHDNVD